MRKLAGICRIFLFYFSIQYFFFHFVILQVEQLNKNIAATQMCTNSSDHSSTACQGDTGGPLMLLTYGYGALIETPVYMQVGIVSHGPDECGGTLAAPAIFTRVSSYAEWILDTIHE